MAPKKDLRQVGEITSGIWERHVLHTMPVVCIIHTLNSWVLVGLINRGAYIWGADTV